LLSLVVGTAMFVGISIGLKLPIIPDPERISASQLETVDRVLVMKGRRPSEALERCPSV
jgi:hypothetical protein